MYDPRYYMAMMTGMGMMPGMAGNMPKMSMPNMAAMMQQQHLMQNYQQSHDKHNQA